MVTLASGGAAGRQHPATSIWMECPRGNALEVRFEDWRRAMRASAQPRIAATSRYQ